MVTQIDPWKSTENTKFYICEVDMSIPDNQNPVQDLEGGEMIETFRFD
jgi:hypothetical protein